MIKYKQVIVRSKIFELTNNKEERNRIPDMKKKYFNIKFFSKNKFISSIIHKFNYFDFFILLTILLVLGFFLYNRFQRKSQWINVRVSVENSDWWYKGNSPYYWYASNIKDGDIAYDSFGKKVAEVIKVDNYDFGGPYRNIYVDLKVRVSFDKKRQQSLFEFKPLVVGSPVIFNFSSQQLRGLIVKVGENEIDYSYKVVKIRRKSFPKNTLIYPEMTEKIKVGDKSFDSNNNLMAEVVDVKKTISSYYEFSDIRGQNIKVVNPDYRDLEITLRIKTFKDLDRNFYINQAVVKVGSTVWFQFPEYSLEDYEIIEIIQ